jgi:hypothetical protein
LPHEPQTTRAAVAAEAGVSTIASELPHILQKFMPALLTVPHEGHDGPAAALGFSSTAAASFWPQF